MALSGAKVVDTLLEYGFVNLRCFVRPSSRLSRFDRGAEPISGGKKCRAGYWRPSFAAMIAGKRQREFRLSTISPRELKNPLPVHS